MAVSDTDLLLIQRGTVPYKTTAADLASYSNTKIELGVDKDVPIASASQLGVIKVGTNLDIAVDGTLSAVIPAGLTYKGVWSDTDAPPSPAANGDFYIWDGANGATLNNSAWGTAHTKTVNNGDRLFYDGSTWSVVTSGGGGLTEITGTAPIVVSAVVDGEQDVSIAVATTGGTGGGYMSQADKDKLDGIDAGAQVNENPTATLTKNATTNTLTLKPGDNATIFTGAVAGVSAGLMTAADKTTLDNLVSSPGGVLSLVAGNGIIVNTATAPGSAGTPEIIVNFAGTGITATTKVLPADLERLQDLP